MKRMGIIGGLGPEATLYYYRVIIDLCYENKDLEGNYPEIIIYSLNLEECRHSMEKGNWPELSNKLVEACQSLSRAGAEFGLIAANTPHMVFDHVREKSPIPLLSIVEETSEEVVRHGLRKVGLIGTLITMQSHFYEDVFRRRNISIAVPGDDEQTYIYEKIRSELGVGIMLAETRGRFLQIAQRMKEEDSIQGLILGCTEIPLLLTRGELGIPFFDTSKIHAQSALRYSLAKT
jgi:aspartate racemase